MCYSADAIRVNKENPSLKYLIPRSGSSLWTDTMVKTAPLDAAYAWINFMLQPQVPKSVSDLALLPNRVAVEQARTSPQQSQLISARIDTAKL